MLTSARPRTLILEMSDVTIDVSMFGPRGQQLGDRHTVPLTTETATVWRAINELGEPGTLLRLPSRVQHLAPRRR